MAKVLITESTLEDIADAIRAKANTNRTYKPSEMAIAIHSLGDEHRPARINIAQTDNQTITVNANLFSASEVQAEHTTSFAVNIPSSVQLNASVTPDTGYAAGELNITNTTASWGSTINFSASQATEKINITITAYSDEKEYDGSELSNSGYTLTGELSEGDVLDDVVVTGSQTEVGSSSNVITSYKILRNGKPINVADYYNVTLIAGILTVTEATVELQPNILMTLNEDIDTSGTISYSVLVENTGDVDLTDVEIACEETGNQWTISSLPIDDNQTFDLADSDSNTIVVTATSGSYSTSQTFHVKIPTEIEAYAEDVTVGDTQVIHGQILPNSATGTVYIDASEFNGQVSISEGSFIVSFTTYTAGSSNCTITYEGDDNHQPSVFEFTYEVIRKPIII